MSRVKRGLATATACRVERVSHGGETPTKNEIIHILHHCKHVLTNAVVPASANGRGCPRISRIRPHQRARQDGVQHTIFVNIHRAGEIGRRHVRRGAQLPHSSQGGHGFNMQRWRDSVELNIGSEGAELRQGRSWESLQEDFPVQNVRQAGRSLLRGPLHPVNHFGRCGKILCQP